MKIPTATPRLTSDTGALECKTGLINFSLIYLAIFFPILPFSLVFIAADENDPSLELTYNWGKAETYSGGDNFGHIAYGVDNIYDFCEKLSRDGVTILRPPRDGRMAFIRSPDQISIELLQKGDALPIKEPWASMKNQGKW